MWIDTHCHPFASDFDNDREEVIERARQAGVGKMIVVGFDKLTNRKTIEMADKYDFMWAALGVHPCDCEDLDEEEMKWIRETAVSNPRVVAIGETGLDYHHMRASKTVQQETFRRQINLAKELNLPVIVHSRDAAEDTLAALLEEKAEKVVFHSYTYDYEFGKKVWAAGYYTAFNGILTFPNAKDIQEAARRGPLDLFLIETDCPYLAPQSSRGKRNEMSHVVEVGRKLGELKGMPLQKLSDELEGLMKRFFKLA